MKRHLLQNIGRINHMAADIDPDLKEFITELQLLHHVPISYIIADQSLLPSECLRFFYIDRNWTEALADGALSIGRVTEFDGEYDKVKLEYALNSSYASLHLPRCKKMHVNHIEKALNVFRACDKIRSKDPADGLTINDIQTDKVVTGFIMRSQLVSMLKNLEVSAYSGDSEIPLLRLDALSDDIAIGLFNGKITSLVISEPKTGLTFGVVKGVDKEGIPVPKLIPKDVSEEKLGVPIPEKEFIIDSTYKNRAGRLNVSKLQDELGKMLGTDIDPAKLAFELIAVANRAVFEEEP